ncbi:glucosamine-6-phosphate deaminase [Paenibacillus sp. yr247]|uniref:glucosamine-6-phosphate deaminase n=1 Tax=Paenibacillus sp. yr247 TaxID=1761880 RepID=UPI00088AB342|nr:glucosamine-6-phosphate deaminase [Paenibacillus sp. yr247]SDO56958.1 glucosamine-6-phosphate deaminase [Paenibacillus sp. yr247]
MPAQHGLVKEHTVDRLKVKVYENREELGRAAGMEVAKRIKELLSTQQSVRIIFAAAPSQNEFLKTLVREEEIEWSRITSFHMDEYIGLEKNSPQRFSAFLRNGVFDIVKPGTVHLIDSSGSIEQESARYANLLQEAPIDIVCMGIGENGHIAFNDPPVADFQDPKLIKPVELDEACRRQQVNDGCFPAMNDVPTHALTLTIPALMSGAALFCMVPGTTKYAAVQQTLGGTISTNCPASILRTHPNCTLYVDVDSYESASK